MRKQLLPFIGVGSGGFGAAVGELGDLGRSESVVSDWDDKQHFWVVVCKNRKFHERQSFWAGYKIFLAETDAYSPLPALPPKINIHCDSCHKVFEYSPKEVLRFEADQVAAFDEHPLFRELV